MKIILYMENTQSKECQQWEITKSKTLNWLFWVMIFNFIVTLISVVSPAIAAIVSILSFLAGIVSLILLIKWKLKANKMEFQCEPNHIQTNL